MTAGHEREALLNEWAGTSAGEDALGPTPRRPREVGSRWTADSKKCSLNEILKMLNISYKIAKANFIPTEDSVIRRLTKKQREEPHLGEDM